METQKYKWYSTFLLPWRCAPFYATMRVVLMLVRRAVSMQGCTMSRPGGIRKDKDQYEFFYPEKYYPSQHQCRTALTYQYLHNHPQKQQCLPPVAARPTRFRQPRFRILKNPENGSGFRL